MNLWKKLSLSILIIILLVIIIIIFLVGTNIGLHLLINTANYWIPGLKVGQITTDKWRDLYLKNINYIRPNIIINIGEIHLFFRLNFMHNYNLCIDNVLLKDVNVSINSKKDIKTNINKGNNSKFNIFLPYLLNITHVALNNINIKIDDITVSVVNLSSDLLWKNKNLTLNSALLQGLMAVIPSKASNIIKEKFLKPKIFNYFKFKGDPIPNRKKDIFSNTIISYITNINLPINLNIQEFKGKQLCFISSTNFIINNMLLKANNNNNCIKIDMLNIDSNQGVFSITGTSQLRDKLPIDITLNSILDNDLLKREKMKLKIWGDLLGVLKLKINLFGKLDMFLNAKINLSKEGIPLNLGVISNQFYWPLTKEKQIKINKLKIKLFGKITDYKIFCSTSIKGNKVPSANINLVARGNNNQIDLNNLTLVMLDSETQIKALISWKHKTVNWYSEIKANVINTIKEVANYPLKLNAYIKANGSFYRKNWQIAIPKLNIIGSFKKNIININGSIAGNNNLQWIIPYLHIKLGNNIVNINGKLGSKELNLSANVNAPRLENILQNIGGKLNGSIELRGNMNNPYLLTSIDASKIHWKTLNIAHLKINSNIKANSMINGYLKVRIEQIMQSNINNAHLIALDINGNECRHVLQLHVIGELISYQLRLIGKLNRQIGYWDSIIDNVQFSTPTESWTLTKAFTLYYHNLKQKTSKNSLNLNILNTKFQKSKPIANILTKNYKIAKLNYHNLTRLRSYILSSNQIRDFFSNKEKIPKGTIMLFCRNLKIIHKIHCTNSLVKTINFINFYIKLYDNYMELKWLIYLPNTSKLEGKLKVSDLYRNSNFNGSINIRNLNLAILNVFFPYGEKLTGILNTNLSLSGNTKSPQLFGLMKFDKINVSTNYISFCLKQLNNLTVQFNGNHSVISGIMYTKQGKIMIIGNMKWNDLDNWHIYININSASVRIALSPTIYFDVSPKIRFEATPKLFILTGYFNVIRANITVYKVPENMINISDDEVMLNENLKPIENKNSDILVKNNLILHLGNNMRIDAFGLKAKLSGDLNVIQDKYGFNLNGQINILEGRFHAYGQDLIVRKGELIFSGPFNRPILNIEAIRNPESTEDNIVVGIRITSLANEPKLEIFSDQEISQQDAISYLIRGRRLNSYRNSNTAITSMLINIGIAQSNQIIDKIGKIFGISNLILDTQGVGDSTKVVVSGYVLPNLQIKYGVGIFNSLSTFTIRYRLSSKLYIEAISDIYRTLDLLYQIEF